MCSSAELNEDCELTAYDDDERCMLIQSSK